MLNVCPVCSHATPLMCWSSKALFALQAALWSRQVYPPWARLKDELSSVLSLHTFALLCERQWRHILARLCPTSASYLSCSAVADEAASWCRLFFFYARRLRSWSEAVQPVRPAQTFSFSFSQNVFTHRGTSGIRNKKDHMLEWFSITSSTVCVPNLRDKRTPRSSNWILNVLKIAVWWIFF